MPAKPAGARGLRKRVKRSLRRLTGQARAMAAAPGLWVEPGHYYSPLPSRDGVRRIERRARAAHRDLPGIEVDDEAMCAWLERLAVFSPEFPYAAESGVADVGADGLRFRLDNSFFTSVDAWSLYAVLRATSPARLIEVGSGFSSALALDVDERFLSGRTSFTFVEPYPKRLRRLLGARTGRSELVEAPVQDVPLGIFSKLGAGDVLFIDSSHVSKLESDVNHLVFEVLPLLAPGVRVHVHDILYPFEYSLEYARERRGWNEAYLLRAFLQFNERFRIRLWSDYLVKRHAARLEAALPGSLPRPLGGSSLWLERVA